MQIHFTLKSSNAKTGPIPVSTTSAETCPPACPFRGSGCYAESGPLALHWRAVTRGERGDSWRAFIGQVSQLPDGQIWRHNQAGDLPGTGARIDASKLAQLVAANVTAGARGFTFTHKPMTAANRAAVRAANAAGFTVNLSANNLTHADTLAALNVAPVVTVLPADAPAVTHTPHGRRVVVCPAQTRDKVTCASCGLCARRDRRGLIIGFRAHGSSHKKVAAIAAGV